VIEHILNKMGLSDVLPVKVRPQDSALSAAKLVRT